MILMECKDCIYYNNDVCERHCSRVFRSNNICEYFVNEKHKINKVKNIKMTCDKKYTLEFTHDELLRLENFIISEVNVGGTVKEMRFLLKVFDKIENAR